MDRETAPVAKIAMTAIIAQQILVSSIRSLALELVPTEPMTESDAFAAVAELVRKEEIRARIIRSYAD